ncbi:allantoinase AllB [Jiella avicenniae]|uniref:allantoinase n=1 Tax=Jiella avicenniae TaxID=2907202 RepID=A0A9X1T4A8_9HYPH|nr:allantoinase AllB [Jiella avicenniae]MCE7027130.1 allantoinase AllB [Jiella avicenniae]
MTTTDIHPEGAFIADLVIAGGTLVREDATVPASIAILDGRILVVGDEAAMPPARETMRAEGLHILPGAIDVHVHFRDPGYTRKEDFGTGTAAAAMGGVTTVFEMPNVVPPTSTPEGLRIKQQAAEKAMVDFGLYGLLGEENLDQIEALIDGGVAAFKCYMGNTFGDLPSPSTGAMLEGFEIVAKHGIRVSLHAETASINKWRQRRLTEAGRHDAIAHLQARPPVVAVEAVSRAAVLAEWTGARIHVLHISSGDELRPLREARARGVDVTGETCPHYLLLDETAYERHGSIVRVNPPVRERAHQMALWEGIADGTIDMIATDHAPHTDAEKVNADIWKADCGFPGIETQMPLMLTEVHRGRLSLEDYVRLSSAAPARSFGLYPRKGTLLPGSDADIAIVDLSRRETIRAAGLHSRSRINPFEGMETVGAPIHTLVRGRFVMRDRKLMTDAAGWGRNVSAKQKMPPPAPRNLDLTMEAVTRPGAGRFGSGGAR